MRATAVTAFAFLLTCARGVPPPEAPPQPPPRPAVELRVVNLESPAASPVQEAPAESAAPPPVPARRPAAPRLPTYPLEVKVGLATDLDSVTFPCCDGDLSAAANGRSVAVMDALRVEPDAGATRPGVYRLQVAALKDEAQAQGLATRLAERTKLPADVVFDAGTDLYRVRVGRYPTREAAEAAQTTLAQVNVHDAWITSEKGELVDPALRLTQGGRSTRLAGRWLTIESPGGGGIRLPQGRYRGRVLVYLNERGKLNLINQVGLDDYLRGVVPREMGPRIYDHLEALKAQTVAARTYTLKNAGEFTHEGYDICATPRCQVYGGMNSEHEMTDAAIAETAGEVLVYEGGLVDAMYSSTCGGHTEDVGVVFPLKGEPYLKGVACLEGGLDRLAGDAPAGAPLYAEINRRLLAETGPSASPAAFGARLARLAELAGLPAPADRLASLERREVQRYIASLFDLALDARLFVAREDLGYLLEDPPPDWNEADRRLAAYLMKSGLLTGPLWRPLSAAEVEETIFHLARFLRLFDASRVRYLGLKDGVLRLRVGVEEREVRLPASVATFRKVGASFRAAALELVPGDRLTLYTRDTIPLGIAQEIDPDGVAYDRTSNLSSWDRFRSDSELAERVRTRYPGLEFRGLEILSRGVSGRVGRMRILGEGGQSVEVQGLPVRWTLDVPDTLFTAKRLTPPGREPGWLFAGRGWGHGVGMCQVGSYGMALRGHTYDSILRHYYTGVEIRRLGG